MKTIKTRKLTLSKVTISNLEMAQMNNLKGGVKLSLLTNCDLCSLSSCDACNTAYSCENTCINCSFPC